MFDDVQYHEHRAAQERAIAASLPVGEARQRHVELADRHAGRAQAIGDGAVNATVNRPNDSLSWAIKRSRELIDESYRILTDSRKDGGIGG